MIDFGESGKIRISRKVDKTNTNNGFSGNILFLTSRVDYPIKLNQTKTITRWLLGFFV